MVLMFSGTPISSHAQKLSGQWIGGFTSSDDPTQNKTDYVLEIEVNGNQVTGYSYTYFSISGKRYFVICKLKGTYERGSKSLSVNEVETVKTNTPPNFQNCLQSHSLTYFKQNDRETLLGKWKPNEKGSTCGKGLTELERKIMQGLKTDLQESKAANTVPKAAPATVSKTPATPQKTEPKENNLSSKTTPEAQKKNNIGTAEMQALRNNLEKSNESRANNSSLSKNENEKPRVLSDADKFKLIQRSYQVIKTIEVEDPEIKVEVYDNGQIDGDTVSLFLNDRMIVRNKMLTAKPISLTIETTDRENIYDLIMYAENLGKIPPNTALMVVTTTKNRYEINITSTEQTSGAVRFVIKR